MGDQGAGGFDRLVVRGSGSHRFSSGERHVPLGEGEVFRVDNGDLLAGELAGGFDRGIVGAADLAADDDADDGIRAFGEGFFVGFLESGGGGGGSGGQLSAGVDALEELFVVDLGARLVGFLAELDGDGHLLDVVARGKLEREAAICIGDDLDHG